MKIKPRRALSSRSRYMESDKDFVMKNLGVAVQLLEQAAALEQVVAASRYLVAMCDDDQDIGAASLAPLRTAIADVKETS